MSDPRRLEGERVFCYQCDNEWDRASGGLTCPRCEGEFTEILPAGGRPDQDRNNSPAPNSDPPPIPRHPVHRLANQHPLATHNPWPDAPDPDEGDITTYQFSTPHGGRGTFSYTSRTYTNARGGGTNIMGGGMMGGFPFGSLGFGGQQQRGGFGQQQGAFGGDQGPNIPGAFPPRSLFPRDPTTQQGPQPGDMQDLFSMIFQTVNQGPFVQTRRPGERAPNAPPNPFDLLGAILNTSGGRHGDVAWSQEAFDRILEQLAEQNGQSGAPGPATESAIKSLQKKKVEKDMLDSDGKAECSICMDNVEIGNDVTVLPCNHWFHGDCVIAWLKEHDTCPHCRKPITNPEEQQPGASRRRSSRRPSAASPSGADGTRDNPYRVPDSPSALREHRQNYYDSRRVLEEQPERPGNSRRHSSTRHERFERQSTSRQSSSGNTGGGVSGWLRNHFMGNT